LQRPFQFCSCGLMIGFVLLITLLTVAQILLERRKHK
jgi:hypothetical protein